MCKYKYFLKPILIVLIVGASCLKGFSLQVDVAIYGGTSAGVIAAYTTKMYGHSVVLIEPGGHLGGMSSGGLGKTDVGNPKAVTGLARDFYRRLGKHYGKLEAWTFEPHVAELTFQRYLMEAQVETLFYRRVIQVNKQDSNIQSIIIEHSGIPDPITNIEVHASIFIDASYEGDLMARAGVSYTVGREPNNQYGERFNGVQLSRLAGNASKNTVKITPEFPLEVDPYVVQGDPTSGLLPLIQTTEVLPIGSGDSKIQAYNFRMCLTQDSQNRLPIPKPDHYDPDCYRLLIRQMQVEAWKSLYDGFIVSKMPNGKTDWNNYGLIGVSTDYIGGNWDYPEADYAQRTEIWQDHRQYQQGLIFFLGHDQRVPEKIRKEMLTWGFCRDEFVDTGGWPHQLYIREARRMLAEYVMTERDSLGQKHVKDGIAYASYPMDSHNCQRVVYEGMVRNEGNTSISGFPPYPISYRAIIPKRGEADNLLVPVCLSASHSVYGSIRMEPTFMSLGQASGVAASIALKDKQSVQDVDAKKIQYELYNNPIADDSNTLKDDDVIRLDFE